MDPRPRELWTVPLEERLGDRVVLLGAVVVDHDETCRAGRNAEGCGAPTGCIEHRLEDVLVLRRGVEPSLEVVAGPLSPFIFLADVAI